MTPRSHVRVAWLWVAFAAAVLAIGIVRDFEPAYFLGCLIMARLHLIQARIEQIASRLNA